MEGSPTCTCVYPVHEKLKLWQQLILQSFSTLTLVNNVYWPSTKSVMDVKKAWNKLQGTPVCGLFQERAPHSPLQYPPPQGQHFVNDIMLWLLYIIWKPMCKAIVIFLFINQKIVISCFLKMILYSCVKNLSVNELGYLCLSRLYVLDTCALFVCYRKQGRSIPRNPLKSFKKR